MERAKKILSRFRDITYIATIITFLVPIVLLLMGVTLPAPYSLVTVDQSYVVFAIIAYLLTAAYLSGSIWMDFGIYSVFTAFGAQMSYQYWLSVQSTDIITMPSQVVVIGTTVVVVYSLLTVLSPIIRPNVPYKSKVKTVKPDQAPMQDLPVVKPAEKTIIEDTPQEEANGRPAKVVSLDGSIDKDDSANKKVA